MKIAGFGLAKAFDQAGLSGVVRAWARTAAAWPPVPVRERLLSLPRSLAEAIDETLAETTGAVPTSASALSRTLRNAL
ncbi:hypothetical protein [Actinomadura darangshiensis]|uniref:hypothetical protein n=1 Tax=Actinomadura darangshiensis TaxID=705336 RepID=UPI0010478EB1|nr:hypothetical protein [Actinomadura darangshiensis]